MATLYEYLEFRARLEPQAIAIQSLGRALTFQQLHALVKWVAGKLRRTGVQPRQAVVTATTDKELDWVLALALAHEGATSCSNHAYSAWKASFDYDWLLTDNEALEGDKAVVVDTSWIRAAQEEYERIDAQPCDESAVARIVLTSGTTGRRKGVALTHAQLVSRAKSSLVLRGAYRTMSLIGLATAGDFNAATACLVTGSPLFVGRSLPQQLEMIRQFSIESIYGSPATLALLVAEIGKSGRPVDCVRMVRMGGSSTPAALVQSIAEHLTDNIFTMYGSTEAGGMCAFKPTARTKPSVAGWPQLDVDVQVVDDAAQPLPAGEEGLVRVKTPHMASGYVGAPEESARAFQDGWFYPGDRGFLNARGLLVLAGRNSEIINVGGAKLDAAVMDQFLAGIEGVADAAVFLHESGAGTLEVVAALVVGEGFDPGAMREAADRKFRKLAPVKYVKVERLPRNELGKLDRAQLAAQLQEKLK